MRKDTPASLGVSLRSLDSGSGRNGPDPFPLRHRMTAIEDTVVLEASTTELTDVVRLEDRYGRAV